MSGIVMENKDMIPIPGAEKFEVEEFSSGPAEIYEPVQEWKLWYHSPYWYLLGETDNAYTADEIYINVSTASKRREMVDGTYSQCLIAIGRLTISNGVAYVDVG